MRIKVISVGKMKKGAMNELLNEYLQRCQWPIEILELNHGSKADESLSILNKISKNDYVILLDETGKSFSSQEFSETFDHLQIRGTSSVTFVIGGATGVDDTIINRADFIMSFGEQTWPHMLVRIMLIEQIYRAEQILKGHPYHKT